MPKPRGLKSKVKPRERKNNSPLKADGRVKDLDEVRLPRGTPRAPHTAGHWPCHGQLLHPPAQRGAQLQACP